MVHLTHSISQPKLETSPMSIPLANKGEPLFWHVSGTWTAPYSFLIFYFICSHVSSELDRWGLGFWFQLVIINLNLSSVSITRFCHQWHNFYDSLTCTGVWKRQSTNPLTSVHSRGYRLTHRWLLLPCLNWGLLFQITVNVMTKMKYRPHYWRGTINVSLQFSSFTIIFL